MNQLHQPVVGGSMTAASEVGGGDGVIVLREDGNAGFGQRRGRCPWGPGYPTRLAEMLEKWRTLVEDGTWRVGDEGVEGEWR